MNVPTRTIIYVKSVSGLTSSYLSNKPSHLLIVAWINYYSVIAFNLITVAGAALEYFISPTSQSAFTETQQIHLTLKVLICKLRAEAFFLSNHELKCIDHLLMINLFEKVNDHEIDHLGLARFLFHGSRFYSHPKTAVWVIFDHFPWVVFVWY